MLRPLLLAAALLSLPALADPPSAKASKGHAHSDGCAHPPVKAEQLPKAANQGWVLTRGSPLGSSRAVPLASLLKNPSAYAGKTVLVEGQVRKACEKKGCWMELATDAKGAGVRVTFKDYAFFVPLDSAGSLARVEGVVKVADLSESHAKHLQDEGAIVPRGKDGKPREVQLLASGVELRR
ncbi:MAG TPA: DUF4920 domain-containing protein [Myxococcaceae bacterium]|nr:DUF4920 domain-containing protein [Myxococcaceae bacterium]